MFIVFLTLLSSFAQGAEFDKKQNRELDRRIFKTQQHLKMLITNDLKLSVGVKEILVDVKVKVSRARLLGEVGHGDKALRRIEKLQLPSLFMGTDQLEKLKEIKTISIENVLANISRINISISSPYDILDEALMLENVRSILAANYERANKVKLKVSFIKSRALLVDRRSQSLSTPMYMNLIDDIKQIAPYALSAVVLLFMGFILFLYLFKKSMGEINVSLDSMDVGGSAHQQPQPGQSPFNALEVVKTNQDDHLPGNSSFNRGMGISTYIELVEKIKFLVKDDHELIEEMILLHFHLGEKDKILVLLNILTDHDKTELYKKISRSHMKDLKEYVINSGEKLYRDEERLNSIAQEFFRFISIAMIKPESFYQIYLKKIIQSFSASEIANVIRACNEKEVMYFIENVDGVKMGFVSATHDLGKIKFSQETEEFTEDEVKKFVHKLSRFIYVKGTVLESNKNTKIIPHLSDEMESSYIKSMGISADLGFKQLVHSNLDLSQEFLKRLDFESLAACLALFKVEERETLMSGLPELVVERILNRSLDVSETSFVLKIKLYGALKTRHDKTLKMKVSKVNAELAGPERQKQLHENSNENGVSDDVA